MRHRLPELVAPAGNWSALRSAVASGADSVYFGIKGFNMRAEASNFDLLEMKKVVDYLHKHNKKAYLALNVIVYDKEMKKVEKILSQARKNKVDALICWDAAVIEKARKNKLKIHLSTQASVANFAALKWYAKKGIRRFVLARECTLKDIKNIISKIRRSKLSGEVEIFIHGAMCVSISGRCFLSGHTFAKSANRGECLQPCRREFLIKDVSDESEYILGKDYVLSPKDLCTIDFLDEVIAAGVNALKIEGRIRSSEYVRVVTAVYRKALDSFKAGGLDAKLKKFLKKELSSVYNRGFSSGFYFGQPQQAISRSLENQYEKVYLGLVRKFYKKISVAEILLQNASIKKGDTIFFSGKKTPASFVEVRQMQMEHNFIDKAAKGDKLGIKVPFKVNAKDKVFAWKQKK